MLTSITIRNFKRFESVTIELDEAVVLFRKSEYFELADLLQRDELARRFLQNLIACSS
ncbi:MAG: hypothetical protein R3C17_14330 [Planctomycetaceae bacterium]